MSKELSSSSPLNEVQMMLLKLFSRPMPKHDENAIRKMLLEYYNNALQKEVNDVIEKKNITRDDFNTILNKQQRTK